jgi:heat-inducible transcriptional repressor
LILKSLITIYISTHKPVSSLQLAQTISLAESSIRKELQKLEKYNFITKTHRSSGRIPTNRGIKFFFRDQLTNYNPDHNVSIDFPEINDSDFQGISDTLLSHLSSRTKNIGFIFLNSLFDLKFRRIRFIKVASYKIMTVIKTMNNWNFSRIFLTSRNYSQQDLDRWQKILNSEFVGKTLMITLKIIRNRLFKEKEKYRKIYHGLYYLLENKDFMNAELFFKGEENILELGIKSPENLKEILETLEEKERLSAFLNELSLNQYNNPAVVFGGDTGIDSFKDLILIFSSFYSSKENCLGNIGVIGPRFMAYPDIISDINYISTYFSNRLSRNLMEVQNV